MDICNICCEKFNKSNKKKIICENILCEFESCKECTRKYLLSSSTIANCMNCKKNWSDKFICLNLNKTFFVNEYKEHRKNVLFEREITKLPEDFNRAEGKKQSEVLVIQNKNINYQIKELKDKIDELKKERNLNCINISRLLSGNAVIDNDKESKKFIMNCASNNCTGFLSSKYKCFKCNQYTCSKCLEFIGENIDEHTCKEENIASANSIKKDTKPCPNCGIRIYKIDGCSQMWCIECKVAFDFNTLKIDNGQIHNPHYYQFIQNQNNGHVVRNPLDIVCGGLCHIAYLHNNIFPVLENQVEHFQLSQKPDYNITVHVDNIKEDLRLIHRVMSHIINYDLPNARRSVTTLQNCREIRINFILGKITKPEFIMQLYKRDNQLKKYNEILHIYELLSVMGIEAFNKLLYQINNDYVNTILDTLLELNNLREYCNKEFCTISKTYNLSIRYISDVWKLSFKKY